MREKFAVVSLSELLSHRGKNRFTGIVLACNQGQIEVVKLLFAEKGFQEIMKKAKDIYLDSFLTACGARRVSVVQFFLDKVREKFAGISLNDLLNHRAKNGLTAFDWVCGHGQIDIVKLLLLKQENFTILFGKEGGQFKRGLKCSFVAGKLEIARFLLEKAKSLKVDFLLDMLSVISRQVKLNDIEDSSTIEDIYRNSGITSNHVSKLQYWGLVQYAFLVARQIEDVLISGLVSGKNERSLESRDQSIEARLANARLHVKALELQGMLTSMQKPLLFEHQRALDKYTSIVFDCTQSCFKKHSLDVAMIIFKYLVEDEPVLAKEVKNAVEYKWRFNDICKQKSQIKGKKGNWVNRKNASA